MTVKVAHLSTAHRADDVRIYHKQCRTLAGAGFDVTIIAAPGGSECGGDVRVRYNGPYSGRLRRFTAGMFVILKMAMETRADLYHFHDPELIPVGLALRALGKRVIYDVHEDLPEQIRSKPWIPAGARSLASATARVLERIAAWRLDGIVAATPAIARRFPEEKTSVVQNFPLPDEFVIPDGRVPYAERPHELVYVGGATEIRGLSGVIEALELVSRKQAVRLKLVGRIHPAPYERELRAKPGWRYVDYYGWCTRAEVGDHLGRARLGIVTFLPVPNHVDSQPNKLFEYMAAGLPVVASDFPLWRRIVGESGCGLLTDPQRPEQIATAIEWLLSNPEEAEAMGDRGRTAVAERYNWSTQSQTLLRFYKDILHEDRDDRGSATAICEGGDCQPSTRAAA